MKNQMHQGRPGIAAALGAALLFGIGTPLAKLLLANVSPWLLAGLLYLGSGVGLTAYRWLTRAPAVRLPGRERYWLAAAILCGGVVGPVLLLFGLAGMSASSASLLLNAEGVFTALLAWVVFHENVNPRVAFGMAAIAVAATWLSWPDGTHAVNLASASAVLGACLAWAIDNNLTRKLALTDATWLAAIKGGVAGVVNLALALALGATMPPWKVVASGLSVGLLAYGVSLTLFVVALRNLGTARTAAYFSVAPFFGAFVAVIAGEPLTPTLTGAAALMALGVWLHFTEHHEHAHVHLPMEHEHEHEHDAHHQHLHAKDMQPAKKHSHWHRHEPLQHAHAHFPDAHHRHDHPH